LFNGINRVLKCSAELLIAFEKNPLKLILELLIEEKKSGEVRGVFNN
jgi:hypothetical protein